MYKRFTTIAGKTIITRYTDSSRIRTEKGTRKPKTRPTPEAVAKVNAINQDRALTAILNANFRPGDLWLVLSHPAGTTIEEAMKKLENFKRNIRGASRRSEKPFRLVEAIGIGKRTGRPHHHIVLNQEITRDMITRYWPEEYVHIETLWSSGNYNRVAKYMLKNALQTKDARGKHKKAWRTSRSVVRPETREEKMKRVPVFDIEDLKPRKGYGIDRDSIRLYEHAITGAYCIEYIEVSLEEEPKLKRYSKGKITSEERWYPESWDEQLSFDMVGGIV